MLLCDYWINKKPFRAFWICSVFQWSKIASCSFIFCDHFLSLVWIWVQRFGATLCWFLAKPARRNSLKEVVRRMKCSTKLLTTCILLFSDKFCHTWDFFPQVPAGIELQNSWNSHFLLIFLDECAALVALWMSSYLGSESNLVELWLHDLAENQQSAHCYGSRNWQ